MMNESQSPYVLHTPSYLSFVVYGISNGEPLAVDASTAFSAVGTKCGKCLLYSPTTIYNVLGRWVPGWQGTIGSWLLGTPRYCSAACCCFVHSALLCCYSAAAAAAVLGTTYSPTQVPM